jgi:hypothetical protein
MARIFGLPKGNNDVSVLDRSPFLAKLLRGEKVGFMVNGTFYPCYYLLVDGIYPPWNCFVQTIPEPQDQKQQHFA